MSELKKINQVMILEKENLIIEGKTGMKIEDIKAIAELVAANELTELKLETEGCTLQIRRGEKIKNVITAAAPAAVAPVAAAPVVAAPTPAAAAAAVPAAPANTIDSPLVGTIYRSASPDAAPFVKVGDKVTADTVVCIVEAMKVMNEIKAEKAGVIKEILIENGSPVEYGQPLFVLE